MQSPFISLPNLLGTLLPTNLADNEFGPLEWNIPNPPIPPAGSRYVRIGCIGDGSCFFHAIAKGLAEIYQLTYQRYTQITEDLLQRFEKSINRPNLFSPYTFNPPRLTPQPIYTVSNPLMFEHSMQTFRTAFVRLLRNDMANLLLTDERLRSIVSRQLRGEIEVQTAIIQADNPNVDLAQAQQLAFNFVIQNLVNELRSTEAVDANYVLLLSQYYNVDIYLVIDRELRNPSSKNDILSEYYNSAVQGPRNMRPPGGPPSRPAIVIIHVGGGHFEIVGRLDNKVNTNFGSNEPLIRRLYEILIEIRSR